MAIGFDRTATVKDVAIRMSEGNLGAAKVLLGILTNYNRIDPDCIDPCMILLCMNEWDILGWKIWVFYKDVCGENLGRMLALIRAVQLGILKPEELTEVLTERKVKTLDVDGICELVKEKYPRINVG